MPTPDLRRILPSARRACASLVASGLVLALAATTAGAAPAGTAQVPSSTSITTTDPAAELSRTIVTVNGSTSWRTGTRFVPFVVSVGSVAGTSVASGYVQIRNRATGEHLYHTSHGEGEQSLEVSDLAPGAHELVIQHFADDGTASSEPLVYPVTVLPPSPTRIMATIVNETVHYQNQIGVEARVETLDGSPVECGSLVAELTDGTDLGELAQGCSQTASLELSGMAHTFDLAPGTYHVLARWEGTSPADAGSVNAGPTLMSQTGPLSVTIRRAGTTTIITGITEDVAAGRVRVDVAVNGQDPDLGGPGEIVLSVNGADMATHATDKLDDTSFVLDAADLPSGMLLVGARYKGSNWHAPSQTMTGWEHTPKVFYAPNPTVSGTAQVGSTIRVSIGIWNPSPSSMVYAWQADGVTIAGAAAPTLKVPASAVGKRITARVTGTTAGYTAKSMTSAPTAAVVPGTFVAPLPRIVGTRQVGKTLAVERGLWSPALSSARYVWKANGVAIATRTTSTFVVPASARGKRLTVTVIGSRTGYTTKSVTSGQTAAIAPGTITAPRPTITGAERVGYTLTVSRGTWSPPPTSVSYTWKADGVKIATRTSNRFVIPASARGKRLTVTVTGSRAGYTTRSVTSDRTANIR